MTIGERLRSEREARGLTQAAMAVLVQASERTVNDWERDVSSPKASVLAALALQGIDVRYVVTGRREYAPPPPLTAEESTLLDRWRHASREVKDAAMGALLGVQPTRPRVEQTFHAPTGTVVTGNASFSGDVVIHEAPNRYGPASKSRAAKPPKKP